jgi:hypothetical protein
MYPFINMDDFNLNGLQESKNEWSSRLINILTPFVIEGIRSMFNESRKVCVTNNEEEKYLMTFQNFLSRTPKWNTSIIEEERKRIVERSNCNYLEDLITCVHIIQLKLLTAVRVGIKQKKINISIPKLDDFVHKIYINTCRKLYSNVYLFELNIPPLQVQKHNRELEVIIQECILNTIRESIPVETILRAYLDETVEEDVEEEIVEKEIKPLPKTHVKTRKRRQEIPIYTPPKVTEPEIKLSGIDDPVDNEIKIIGGLTQPTLPVNLEPKISFNDVDSVRYSDNKDTSVVVSKDPVNLELLNSSRKELEPIDDSEKLKIFDEPISLDTLNFETLTPVTNTSTISDNLLGDIMVLNP